MAAEEEALVYSTRTSGGPGRYENGLGGPYYQGYEAGTAGYPAVKGQGTVNWPPTDKVIWPQTDKVIWPQTDKVMWPPTDKVMWPPTDKVT